MSEKRLIDEAREVVAKLPGKWTVKDNSDGDLWAAAENCDGRRLHFRADDRKGNAPRIEISGTWPLSQSSGVITPSLYADEEKGTFGITVARNRGAAAIAAEIERRLLPDYSRVFAICKARAEQYDDYEKRRNEAAAELRQLVGDTKNWEGRDPNAVCACGLDCHEIRVSGPESIRLVIDTDLAGAKLVIAALKKNPKTSD